MLYAVLCYNSEDVVGAWSKEEDDAVMARLAQVQENAARQGRLGPVARLFSLPRLCGLGGRHAGTKVRKLALEPRRTQEATMRFILFIIVIILLLGALPTWPYSTGWGYYPSGGLGLILIILLILLLLGRI